MTPRNLADTLARDTDPETSQEAAAAVAPRLSALKVAVLELFALRGRPMAGSKGNEQYQKWRGGHGWPKAAPDTPRKRMGELAAQGFLSTTRKVKGPNGADEAVYELTAYGRAYLESIKK